MARSRSRSPPRQSRKSKGGFAWKDPKPKESRQGESDRRRNGADAYADRRGERRAPEHDRHKRDLDAPESEDRRRDRYDDRERRRNDDGHRRRDRDEERSPGRRRDGERHERRHREEDTHDRRDREEDKPSRRREKPTNTDASSDEPTHNAPSPTQPSAPTAQPGAADSIASKFGLSPSASADIASKFGTAPSMPASTPSTTSNPTSAPPKRKSTKLAPPNEPMMLVTVNDRLGTKAQIPCLGSDTVRDFKTLVALQIGRKAHEILIKRQSERPFKDALTLEDYGVSNGVQLDLELDTGD